MVFHGSLQTFRQLKEERGVRKEASKGGKGGKEGGKTVQHGFYWLCTPQTFTVLNGANINLKNQVICGSDVRIPGRSRDDPNIFLPPLGFLFLHVSANVDILCINQKSPFHRVSESSKGSLNVTDIQIDDHAEDNFGVLYDTVLY